MGSCGQKVVGELRRSQALKYEEFFKSTLCFNNMNWGDEVAAANKTLPSPQIQSLSLADRAAIASKEYPKFKELVLLQINA